MNPRVRFQKRMKNLSNLKSLKIFVCVLLCFIEFGFSILPLGGNSKIYVQKNDVNYPAARSANISPPPTMSSDVIEVNTTPGSKFGPYQAIYQYGDSEVGVFYSMSGNATQNATRNVSGFNVTLPADYYGYWNLSYINFFNATPVISQNKSQYFPVAPSANISYPLTVNLTGIDFKIQEINLPIVNATNMSILFDNVNLTTGDSLRIYNDSGMANNTEPLYEFAPGGWGLNNTPWLNTTHAYIVLNSSAPSSRASYNITLVNYQGNINLYQGSLDEWNWTITVDPEVCGFNFTLSQLSLPEGSRMFYSDPWGNNVTELWNIPGVCQNYTYVRDNFTLGQTWGPNTWIDPEYVVIAFNCNDTANYAKCNFTVGAIEYLVTRGWCRLYFPENTNQFTDLVQYAYGSPYVNVSFASFEKGGAEPLARYYPSWSFLFKKIPTININISYLDENTKEWLPDPVLLHHDGNYTLRVNVTNATNDPIDWSNINGAPPNSITLHFAQGESFRYQAVVPLYNGIANFTLNHTAGFGLENLTGGEVIAVITVGGVNYGIFDNTSSRTTDHLYFFERPTFKLNSITSEVFGTTTSSSVITTVGTNYDPNFVFFNVSATDAFNNSEPLNGQPVNVSIWKENPLTKEYQMMETRYVYQSYQPDNGTSYLRFPYSFRDVGNWSVTFKLLNESINKPQGYYDPTNDVTANVTVIVRDLGLDIFAGPEGLNPGQVSPIFVSVTDREESGFPLVGWDVDLYFWRKMGAHWEDYYIGSTTSNNSGIAKLNWLPPLELAGKQVFLQAVARTPQFQLYWYEANETQVERGFELTKLGTNLVLATDRPSYTFQDYTTFTVTLNDEIGRVLVGETVQVDATYIDTTYSPKKTCTFNCIIGTSNSGIEITPPTGFIGTIEFNMTYLGGPVTFGTFSSVNRSVTKIPTKIILNLTTFGYNFGNNATVPVKITAVDARTGNQFSDLAVINNSLKYELYNVNGTLLGVSEYPITNLSTHIFQDWAPSNSNIFVVRAMYTGGDFYEASEVNQTVFIDRAAIDISLDIPPISIFAGQDLVVTATARFHVNQTLVDFPLPILFTYTDLLGNTYVLDCVYTTDNPKGQAKLVYSYHPSADPNHPTAEQLIYENMVVFGGQLTATSMQSIQYKSGFAIVRHFKIPKCNTSISIRLSRTEVSPGGSVTIEVDLNTPAGVTVSLGLLTVEISSNTGYSTGEQTYAATDIVLPPFSVIVEGVYYVKVIYKGNNLFETSAEIANFTCGHWVLTSEGGAQSTELTAQSVLTGTAPYLFDIAFGLFLLIVIIFGGYKKKTSKLNQKRVKGLLTAILFLIADIGGIVNLVNSMPNPYLESLNPNSIQINPISNFNWLTDENLPEEDRQQFDKALADASVAKAIANTLPSMNNYQGLDPSIFDGLSNIGQLDLVQNLPRTADAGDVYDLNLGFFGKLPYPIGDILNVSFTVNNDSNYFITITNLATMELAETIFGSCKTNENVEIMIPIDEGHFVAGVDYALELQVYAINSWVYGLRDMKRMTFSVVKGFTEVKMEAPSVEVYNRKTFKVTLTDKLSGKPVCYEKVQIYVWDEDILDYVFYQDGTTDANGEISLALPKNAEQGEVPMRVAYNGNIARFGVGNSTSYSVDPIKTYISISASPVHYRDNGTLAALLYDQFGFKLDNRILEFYIHLENVLIGDSLGNSLLVEDQWIYVGNAVTNGEGYCSIGYNAYFPEGFYELRVNYAGDAIYNSTTSSGNVIEVQKELLNINFLPNNLTYGRPGFVSAYLYDDEGEAAIDTPITFSGYYEHAWHDLGGTNTTSAGLATINTTVYWDEGTYVLRLIKEEDDRFATNVEYGNLTVTRTLSGLDIIINSTTYCEEMTLKAILTCQNGTVIDPVENEALLFYVVTNIAGGNTEFLYIGYGVTDSEGRAKCIGTANLLPGMYMVRVFFPGNDFMKPIDAYEYGLEIRKADARITIRAPGTVPILDYADFSFNLSDPHGNPVAGERMHVLIYNSSNPLDIVTEANVTTDGHGVAFFRWVPATLGLYTIETSLESDRYIAPTSTSKIEVIRKAVTFNITMNSIQFHRGEECDLAGNVTFAYKHQNGTAEYFSAPAVPLVFYIWNESSFIHPVSGFLVPNVPLLNNNGQAFTTTGSEDPYVGQFTWSFVMPDKTYGLQSGRYFVKVKVDTTRTGFYEGQCYLSFDLVEYTQMNITVDPSPRVTALAGDPRLARTNYYVDENETVIIQLREQDNQTLQPWNEFGPTFRNLTINIGTENIVTFGVDPDGTPHLYNTTQDFTGDGFHNPIFYPSSGTYIFTWAPFLAGPSDVGVIFSGDRFFEANGTSFTRIVSTRPVIMNSTVTYTQELYRQGVVLPYTYVQTFTEFEVRLWDLISGEIIPDQRVEFYYDNQLMTVADHYGIEPNYTNAEGYLWNRWDIPGDFKFIQAGEHQITFLSVRSRNFTAEWSPAHDIYTWETTHVSVTYRGVGEGITRVTVNLWDQDWEKVNDGIIAVQINGMIDGQDSSNYGGKCREFQFLRIISGSVEFDCNLADLGLHNGNFWISADFIGDWIGCYRASSIFVQGTLTGGDSGGVLDQVRDNTTFAVQADSTIYHSLHEIRQYVPEKSTLMVKTYDHQGFKPASDVFYVWQKPEQSTDELIPMDLYFLGGNRQDMGVILAFGVKANATSYVEENQEFLARLVDYTFVWSLQSSPFQGSSVSAGIKPKVFDQLQSFSGSVQTNLPLTAGFDPKNDLSPGAKDWGALMEQFAYASNEMGLCTSYELLFRIIAGLLNGNKFPYYVYERDVKWVTVFDLGGNPYEVPIVKIQKHIELMEFGPFLAMFLADKVIESYASALNKLITQGIGNRDPGSTNDLLKLFGRQSEWQYGKGALKPLDLITKDMIWGVLCCYGETKIYDIWEIGRIIFTLVTLTYTALKLGARGATATISKGIEFIIMSVFNAILEFIPGYNFMASINNKPFWYAPTEDDKATQFFREQTSQSNLYSAIFDDNLGYGDILSNMWNYGVKGDTGEKIKWELGGLVVAIGGGIIRFIMFNYLGASLENPVVKGINNAVSTTFSACKAMLSQVYKTIASRSAQTKVKGPLAKLNEADWLKQRAKTLASCSLTAFIVDLGMYAIEQWLISILGAGIPSWLISLVMQIVKMLILVALSTFTLPSDLPSSIVSFAVSTIVSNLTTTILLEKLLYPYFFGQINKIMYNTLGYIPLGLTIGTPRGL